MRIAWRRSWLGCGIEISSLQSAGAAAATGHAVEALTDGMAIDALVLDADAPALATIVEALLALSGSESLLLAECPAAAGPPVLRRVEALPSEQLEEEWRPPLPREGPCAAARELRALAETVCATDTPVQAAAPGARRPLLGLPLELAAGVGLAALFGAAANTPLALSFMAVELLGASVLPHVVIVTVTAYLLTGARGIYPAQCIARLKHGGPLLERLLPLRDLKAPRPPPAPPSKPPEERR